MRAVVKIGSKQYFIEEGDLLEVEKINRGVGEEIELSEVLLLKENGKLEIGKPVVQGAKVIAEILEHKKGKKIVVLKYKKKRRYKVKRGHRQKITKIKIKQIKRD